MHREEIEYNFYAFVSSIFVTNGLLLHGFALDLMHAPYGSKLSARGIRPVGLKTRMVDAWQLRVAADIK